MFTGKILFAQLMDFLPWTTFARIVERYGGDRYVKSLRCAEHFRVMAFAQLTYRESLRDIEACLAAHASTRAVRPKPRIPITWDFANRFDARRCPMPTKLATGASTPTSPRC